MNVFEVTDYKRFLKYKVQETRGNLTALAKAIQCQASYLLRVINEQAHLTPDQAYRLCKYWNFQEDEQTFFMLLVEEARAGDREYRAHLKTKITELLEARNNLKETLERDEATEIQKLLVYHGDWRLSLLHFLTACSGYQRLEALGARVGMTERDLHEALNLLQQNGLIDVEKGRAKYRSGAGHIPRGSPVLPVFLSNWRQLAVQRSMRNDPSTMHFTNVQTIGKDDGLKLLELARQFVRKAKNICDESSSEEVVALNLDIFVP